MIKVAWILFGLIPGFLAVALVTYNKKKVRVKSDDYKWIDKNEHR